MSARGNREAPGAVGALLERVRGRGRKPGARRTIGYNATHRVALVGGVLALCGIALVARAFHVQVVDNEFYLRQGDARALRELPIATSRGMITDRNGEPLAVSTPVESLWANPQELLQHTDRIGELAAALSVPADTLASRLSQRADKEFMYLRRRINPAAAGEVLELGIPGVYSQREYRRFYPQGEALAHVLGFTNVDDHGQEGLELAFEDWLSGTPGAKRVIRDGQGRIIENVDLLRAPEPGRDLVLSIDRRIQYLAFRELRRAITEAKAAAGSVVILDVHSGEILAMANLPSYNPNQLDGQSGDARRNRAVTDVVEPGSTMKPITVAAAMEHGLVTPDTIVDTSPGYISNGRYTINDFRNYGALTATGVLTKSSNVGSAKLARELPDGYFHQFIQRFGYGRKPGSGFPGEASGLLAAPAQWSGTSKSTMSYGYGLSATPLQIAVAYAAIANGGRRLTPTFVKGGAGEGEQIMEPALSDSLLHMMQTVTETGGTATGAAILGYHVAGKTGTARKFSSTGGYSRDYVALFAGVVPVENPRFAMAVLIDEPDASKGHGYGGGATAAPVFKSVMEGALRLMDVPPDDIETWIAAQAKKRGASEPTPVLPLATAAPAVTGGGRP
ncbi:penicillin-binding protein 2 [Lysobacter sp. GX 14042]|uniref:peptidoglycan D,D-transpeptidase FtsI family protein n=1 Tax=Lysobacter sp. GX 14042 TaxID=2907155 RepID=UPI0031BA11C0